MNTTSLKLWFWILVLMHFSYVIAEEKTGDVLSAIKLIERHEVSLSKKGKLSDVSCGNLILALSHGGEEDAKIVAIWELWLDGGYNSELLLAWWSMDNRYRRARAFIVALFSRSEPNSATVPFDLYSNRFAAEEAAARVAEAETVHKEIRSIAAAFAVAIANQAKKTPSERLKELLQIYQSTAMHGIRDLK